MFDAPAQPNPGGDRAGPEDPAAAGSSKALAAAGVAGAILVGAFALVIAMTGSEGGIVHAPTSSSSSPGVGGTAANVGHLVVDVSGAVVAPGVYRLPPGSRVGDAIDMAGGFSPRVDADRVAASINLAAELTDGQQIRVPSRDDPDEPGAGPGSDAGAGKPGGTSLIDLNSATQSELESLPGIGPVTAGKIMESRAAAPFGSVDELRSRGLVGEKTFEDLRALVKVG